jgi:hypothetical protein
MREGPASGKLLLWPTSVSQSKAANAEGILSFSECALASSAPEHQQPLTIIASRAGGGLDQDAEDDGPVIV